MALSPYNVTHLSYELQQNKPFVTVAYIKDSQSLSYYNVQKDSTMHLVIRERGGMHHESSGRVDYQNVNFCSSDAPNAQLDVGRSVPAKRLTIKYKTVRGHTLSLTHCFLTKFFLPFRMAPRRRVLFMPTRRVLFA